ncbi:t-SNARE [Geopyxis carbonaria]|nr:t-SNARE [Geopyxis carbonaria]
MAYHEVGSIPLLSQPSQQVPLPLQNFLGEISTFATQLQTFNDAISYLASLHDEALRSTESSTAGTGGTSAVLEAAVADATSEARELKDALKSLERDVLLTERDSYHGDGDAETKRRQWEKIKRDLQNAIREYENTERGYRQRYQDQAARQYRIVNPSATDEEISAAVYSGETQVFSQAILNSNRSASATSVARAVRERQKDITRIEKTLEELLHLFEQMNEQVVLAEPVVAKMEENVDQTRGDLEGAVTHLDTGTKHLRSRNRKKWYLLGVCILIIVVIAIIIAIVVSINKKK